MIYFVIKTVDYVTEYRRDQDDSHVGNPNNSCGNIKHQPPYSFMFHTFYTMKSITHRSFVAFFASHFHHIHCAVPNIIHINTMDCKYFCRENGIKTWKMTFPYEFDAWFRNGVYANVGGTLKAWHRNHYKAMEIIKIGTHSRVLLNTALCEHV